MGNPGNVVSFFVTMSVRSFRDFWSNSSGQIGASCSCESPRPQEHPGHASSTTSSAFRIRQLLCHLLPCQNSRVVVVLEVRSTPPMSKIVFDHGLYPFPLACQGVLYALSSCPPVVARSFPAAAGGAPLSLPQHRPPLRDLLGKRNGRARPLRGTPLQGPPPRTRRRDSAANCTIMSEVESSGSGETLTPYCCARCLHTGGWRCSSPGR